MTSLVTLTVLAVFGIFVCVVSAAPASVEGSKDLKLSSRTDVVECPTCDGEDVCAGTDTDKRCVHPMGEGEPCGQDPFWICADGLVCEHGTCKKTPIPEGESCLGDESNCAEGLVCAGSDHEKKCVHPMGEGEPCGQDPFWICADGLVCEHGTCKKPPIPEGESCLGDESNCAEGLICAGSDHEKKCVHPMGEGEPCGQDPFWVCADGLVCEHGTCKKPPIPEGESCLGDESNCAAGLVCAGSDHEKKCVHPMGEGEPCGQDPYWVCDEHLTCEHDICVVY